MGEIASSLGLGGNTGQKYPADVYNSGDLSRAIGNDSSGFSLPGINTPPPQAMQAMPSIQGGGPGAQPVMADNWQPHKRTTLGFLADALLSGISHSSVTPFADKSNRQNMQEAMEGFTQDPEKTIQRIAKINPSVALALQEKYTDNSRQQGNLDRQNNVFDMQKEQLVYNRVAGMMGGANDQTWEKMRQMAMGVGKQYGVDVSPYIPEKYDPDSINFMRNGAIKPIDQEKLKESHEYHGDVIDTRQRGQDLSHGDRMRGQDLSHGDRVRGQDLSHGDRVDAEAGRNNRHANPVARPSAAPAQSVMTKYGPLIPGKSNPNNAVLHRDGKTYGYTKINGTWVPVGEVTLK